MPTIEESELLDKIYNEIIRIKEELDEIKHALVKEEEPHQDEIEELTKSYKEMKSGKAKNWAEVKKRSWILMFRVKVLHSRKSVSKNSEKYSNKDCRVYR